VVIENNAISIWGTSPRRRGGEGGYQKKPNIVSKPKNIVNYCRKRQRATEVGGKKPRKKKRFGKGSGRKDISKPLGVQERGRKDVKSLAWKRSLMRF